MFRNAALGPHHDATPKQFPSAAVGQHHDAAPGQHLGAVPGQHPSAAAKQYPGAASSQPCPAPDPPPLRIGPITSQHCLGALPGTQKQKIGPNCNFFAIGNCCELPNRESRHKNAGNLPCEGPFSLCGDREEFAIAKKLQRCRDFCFHDGRIVPTDRFHDGRIAATGGYRRGGGSPQRGKSRRCAYSRRQRGQQRLGSLIGRGAPPRPCRIGLGGSPCAEGFAADWTERQPLGLEAAGEGRLWVWLA